MQIIGKFGADNGSDAGADARSDAEVARVAREYGGILGPLHRGENDPALSRWFVVDGVDAAAADALAGRLRALPGVDGAYAKPPGEPPAGV